jgi:hypothetical protein
VAVEGQTPLPRAVQDWIRQTTRRLRSHAGAFLTRFHRVFPGNPQNSPAPAWLQPIGTNSSAFDFPAQPVNPFAEKPPEHAKPLRIVPTWARQCKTRFRCSITFKRMD